MVEFLASLMYTLSSEKSKSLNSFFPICITLLSFCYLIALHRTLSNVLNRYIEDGQPILFLILVEVLWVSLHLIWCWLLACWKLLLLSLGMLHVSLISPRPLSWRSVGFCQMVFQHLMWWSYGVFFFQFVWIVDYIYRFFHRLNHSCISELKPTWL